jgi:hypothetical protein
MHGVQHFINRKSVVTFLSIRLCFMLVQTLCIPWSLASVRWLITGMRDSSTDARCLIDHWFVAISNETGLNWCDNGNPKRAELSYFSRVQNRSSVLLIVDSCMQPYFLNGKGTLLSSTFLQQRRRFRMLHIPYHSFSTVVDLLTTYATTSILALVDYNTAPTFHIRMLKLFVCCWHYILYSYAHVVRMLLLNNICMKLSNNQIFCMQCI